MRVALAILSCLALGACDNTQGRPLFGDARFGGPALISGHSPPNAISRNSEPEPVNSLPPGAEGIGALGPNGRFPNAGAFTVGTPL